MPWLHRRFPDRKIIGDHNSGIYCKMFHYCSQDIHYRQQLYSWHRMINSPNKSYCKLSRWQLHHSGGWGASGWCRAQQGLLLPNTKPFTRNWETRRWRVSSLTGSLLWLEHPRCYRVNNVVPKPSKSATWGSTSGHEPSQVPPTIHLAEVCLK